MKHRSAAFSLFFAAAIGWSGCGSDSDDDDTSGGDGGAVVDAQVLTPDSGTSFARGPDARAEHASVFDPVTGKLLVFGGDKGTVQNQMAVPNIIGDSWVLDTRAGTWHMVTGGPSARSRTAYAYDSVEKRALVFGGSFRTPGTTGAYTLYDEVWAFYFETEVWNMISSNGAPPSRRLHAAAGFDAMSRRMIVYGGNTSTSGAIFAPVGDVYSINAMTGDWTALTPTGTPPAPRHYAQYAFDEGRRRLIIVSGKGAGFFDPSFADTWALDVSGAQPAWIRLNDGVSGAPPARFGGSLIYDMARDRMLLFGGHHDQPPFGDIANDTWQLNLATGAWTRLRMGDTFNAERCIVGGAQVEPLGFNYSTPDLMSPERRFKHTLAADSAGGRVLLFGGESDCAKLDDAWLLDLATTDGVWSRATRATQGEGWQRRADQCPCYCN